jgi:hypothetical protein
MRSVAPTAAPSRWPVRPVPAPAPVSAEGKVRDTPDDLTADLQFDGDRIHVSIVGGTGDGPGVPYRWCDAGQPSPDATLAVTLGECDGRRLCLDLGRCPDTLTVAGRTAAAERYALLLISQVLADGHGVTVLGADRFAGALPAGCHRVDTLRDLDCRDAPGIVVCGRLSGHDLAAARLSRASGGPIPVLVGDIPRARWSVRVGRPDPDHRGTAGASVPRPPL